VNGLDASQVGGESHSTPGGLSQLVRGDEQKEEERTDVQRAEDRARYTQFPIRQYPAGGQQDQSRRQSADHGGEKMGGPAATTLLSPNMCFPQIAGAIAVTSESTSDRLSLVR
jgi:hypothetical protein